MNATNNQPEKAIAKVLYNGVVFSVRLIIGHQSFKLDITSDTEHEEEYAQWYADQLNKALARIAPPFPEALRLLRDLADAQNGPPLEKDRAEWQETMNAVYAFLKQHETE